MLFLGEIRTMREIYNTKRAKSEHAAGYGVEPKNSAGWGICLNFLVGYGIRTQYPPSGAPPIVDYDVI